MLQFIPLQMEAQKEKWLGDPILHGVYEPEGHPGRTFTFWNNGEFTSMDSPSCLEVRKSGVGHYELEGKTLKLVFLNSDSLAKSNGMAAVEPHEEEYRISLKGNTSYEISQFRIKSREKTQAKLIWRRVPGELPYRMRQFSKTQVGQE